ncbi:M55 family metallopeptidase [Paracoccus sp. Z118]|uniref:M55 family metallopeptidase n=1 Tax=Paracoccus sp. Z118 TaxID=2851017 RepID=UPI001C2C2678|nr:M55 family metallopeptidase [Paracoccus sp. Z118]MBV0891552.1 M55 family metallopeptidase [Paracoccus sp. Z118]
MKIFISADIEGTAAIANWDETRRTHSDWAEFRQLMTAEVLAACEGAMAAGAEEIVIKDAHDSGRNLIADLLPEEARIVRGWSGHPDSMMFGIDETFDAAIYTGYHAKAGTEDNPLAHTSNGRISRLLLNGEVASEFTMNALCAARYGVGSFFIAGDSGICADARAMVPGIGAVETLQGCGPASDSISPAKSRRLIRDGVAAALESGKDGKLPQMPGQFEMVLEFNNPTDAYRARFYPGAQAHGLRAAAFESGDFGEILRAFGFMKV